jgi:GTP 3',8-cyclase
VLDRITAQWPVTPVPPPAVGQVAEQFTYDDGAGRVGVIASVTRPFCRGCSRARLSSVGELYTCLFATRGIDLRAMLRDGARTEEVRDRIVATWSGRTDRYSELRTDETRRPPERVEMSYIGG